MSDFLIFNPDNLISIINNIQLLSKLFSRFKDRIFKQSEKDFAEYKIEYKKKSYYMYINPNLHNSSFR